MLVSYDHVQRGGENFQRLTFEAHAFAVHHCVYRTGEFEINALGGGAGSFGMMDVRAGEKARQSPDQAEAADGRPADIFDEAVRGIGVGSDHHVAAGEFAVVEGEEEGGVAIGFRFFGEAVWEGEMLELHEAREHAEDVAEFAPAFEAAVGGFSYVGGEAESEQIQEIEFALGVAEADYVAGAAVISL